MIEYNSFDYKTIKDEIDTSVSFFLENPHDQPQYSYLNWRMNGAKESLKYKEIGEGFFISAIVQLERCLEYNGDRKGDALIFSVLFNLTHALELYLKALIILCHENRYSLSIKTKTHNVISLSNDLKRELNSEYNDLYMIGCKDFDFITKLIDYVFSYTKDPTFARYPFDNNNKEQFYVNSKNNIVIDMEMLCKWVKASFYILDRNYINLKGELYARV